MDFDFSNLMFWGLGAAAIAVFQISHTKRDLVESEQSVGIGTKKNRGVTRMSHLVPSYDVLVRNISSTSCNQPPILIILTTGWISDLAAQHGEMTRQK